MPWIRESIVTQRLSIVERMLLADANISEICLEANISRKTAYKWLNRYKAEGIKGLEDLSRSRHIQPQQVSASFEDLVVNTHKTYPYWGPKKLRNYLQHVEGIKDVPAHTTFGRILKRRGCEVIKNNKSKDAKIRFERSSPNELWQMDFKGSFMTEKMRCYPLTILDDYSRYSLTLTACKNERAMTVKEQLSRVFKEYGMPYQINVDNGNPWGCSDLASQTSLQIWLFKLGIKLSHSAPYHPQNNGKEERFHRTLKLEVLHDKKYRDCYSIQRVFDEWRHLYNYKRPHEALGGKPPSSRYQVSLRPFPSALPEVNYEKGSTVRKVHATRGTFVFKGKRYRAGKGLHGEYIAIEETSEPQVYAIFFMDNYIKKFNIGETT